MANKIRPKRSSVAGHRPLSDVSDAGELYINIADKQIGFHDDQGHPVDVVAVRRFDGAADYTAGDLVVHKGKIYKALVNINQPGFFNSARWDDIAKTPHIASNLPTPGTSDRGKALVVNGVGMPTWGAEVNNAAQVIFGGQF